MKEAIDKTKQYLKTSKDPLFWSLCIVRELCDRDYNLAIQWMIECLKIRLSKCEKEQAIKLKIYLPQDFNLDEVSAIKCFEISRKIWYLPPERNRLQNAVSGLWANISYLKRDKKLTLSQVNFVISLISSKSIELGEDRSIDYHFVNQYIEAALKIHQEYIGYSS